MRRFCEMIIHEIREIVQAVMAAKEQEELNKKAKELEQELFENS